MIINAVGCPYSGTEILKDLLTKAGIRTRDEGADLIHDRRLIDARIPYNCKDLPEWVISWMNKFEMNGFNDYMNIDKHFFHDSWGRSCAVRALEKKYPNLRFLIMIRSPREMIGKWFYVSGSSGPEITIETYKNTVLKIYSFLVEQADFMETKPFVMDYELFVKNRYNKFIFDMFDIEHSLENYHTAQIFLKSIPFRTHQYEGNIDEIVSCQNQLKKWLIQEDELVEE